jgi:hypothetical protein
MQIDVKHTVAVNIALTESEARWLQGVMQNPLHGQPPEREAVSDRRMRALFWEALTGALPRD